MLMFWNSINFSCTNGLLRLNIRKRFEMETWLKSIGWAVTNTNNTHTNTCHASKYMYTFNLLTYRCECKCHNQKSRKHEIHFHVYPIYNFYKWELFNFTFNHILFIDICCCFSSLSLVIGLWTIEFEQQNVVWIL